MYIKICSILFKRKIIMVNFFFIVYVFLWLDNLCRFFLNKLYVDVIFYVLG